MDKSEIIDKLSEELSNTDWVEDHFILYDSRDRAISLHVTDEDGVTHEFK